MKESTSFAMRESTSELTGREGGGSKHGCTVSIPMAFCLLLLALVIAVGVGLIVFFATGGTKIECKSADGDLSSSEEGGVWIENKDCLSTCISNGYCKDEDEVTDTPPVMTSSSSSSKLPDKVRDVRLPLWLIPVHYDVEMKPDIYQDDPTHFTNTGTVSVLMDCEEPTDRVTIHINKLTVTTYELKQEGGPDIVIKGQPVYDVDRQFVNFTLDTTLTKGTQYRLTLGYEGPLANDLAGIYYSSYDVTDDVTNITSKRYIATTQYQPTDGRKAFPCFDEPALKATFKVSLWRKADYTALSNMPLEKSDPVTSNGWIKDTFEPTVKMSTYLLAMIVCDFEYIESYTTGGTQLRVWSRKSAIDQTDYALDQGLQILTYFESFFNESFPLPKQDMIAIPDFAAGAMENWGLITYRETALLYDPAVSSAANKQYVTRAVSHELAHQWFGNLVSPSWWDDLWLNEGFASYCEYIGMNHTQPDWNMMEQVVLNIVHTTLRSDSLATSHPIYVSVQHPDEINEIFDSISYGKGGSLIRMIRYFLGNSVFQKALSNYIDDKSYEAAHHTDLWRSMQEEANKQGLKDDQGKDIDVRGVLDTWILQMGYPLLEVLSNPTNGNKQSLTITQSHFLQDESQEPDPKFPSPFGYTWDVPVSYVTSKDPNFDVAETSVNWFFRTDKSISIEIDTDADWLIINPKQYGFYRVNYPESFWQKLIDQQTKNHLMIDPLNRAQIIDDAFNLALAGKLRITYPMQLTKYLGLEDSYFPWKATITSLEYVSSALKLTDAYGDFEKYYRGLLLPFYNKFNGSWQFDNNRPIVNQYRQSEAIRLACEYDVSDCRSKAKELLDDLMADPGNNVIHPNVKSTVYCYGVQQGGVDTWNFIYRRFKSENVAAEAVKLLRALGCTDEIWLLQRLLDYAIDDDKIRKQDSFIAVDAVSKNSIGRYLAWDWLRANWDFLLEKIDTGIFLLGRFVNSITANMFSPYDYAQLEAFIAGRELGTASRAFSQAKERSQNNIKYLNRNQAALTEWLRNTIDQV